MRKLRAAIVGTTFIARAHRDAIARMPEAELAAVCGMDRARTEAFAAQYGIARWYTDINEMIVDGGIDVLHNCAANRAHDHINRAAIAAGIHVYTEKPMSDSAEDALHTWRMARAAGVLHGLNHQYRMNPAVQEMRARVARGELGRVFFASGHYHQDSGLLPEDYRARMREPGVTWALADIGVHWVDTACCVLGERPSRVLASLYTAYPERIGPDGAPYPCGTDDLGSVMLAFPSGARGAFTASKLSAGHMNDLTLDVDGRDMSMQWAQESPGLLRLGYRGQPNVALQVAPRLMDAEVAPLVTLPGGHPLGWNDALLASVREFYEVVLGTRAQSAMRCATFEDGYALAAFVDAAMRSSASDAWVDITYERP